MFLSLSLTLGRYGISSVALLERGVLHPLQPPMVTIPMPAMGTTDQPGDKGFRPWSVAGGRAWPKGMDARSSQKFLRGESSDDLGLMIPDQLDARSHRPHTHL